MELGDTTGAMMCVLIEVGWSGASTHVRWEQVTMDNEIFLWHELGPSDTIYNTSFRIRRGFQDSRLATRVDGAYALKREHGRALCQYIFMRGASSADLRGLPAVDFP